MIVEFEGRIQGFRDSLGIVDLTEVSRSHVVGGGSFVTWSEATIR